MSQSTSENATDRLRCPHCNGPLDRFAVPNELAWNDESQLACFNNDCPYYKEGWEWMKQQYNQEISYRYRICPSTGAVTPLPVWSDDALRDRIIKE